MAAEVSMQMRRERQAPMRLATTVHSSMPGRAIKMAPASSSEFCRPGSSVMPATTVSDWMRRAYFA